MPSPNSEDARLNPLLGSPSISEVHGTIQLALDTQLRACLSQSNGQGLEDVVKYWHLWQPKQKQQLLESEYRLTDAIRKSLYDSDARTKANAFAAIADLLDLELLDDLVKITIQPNYVHKETSAQLIKQLAFEMFKRTKDQKASASAAAVAVNANHQAIDRSIDFFWPANRTHFRLQMEIAVREYKHHKRKEILLAYLLFADYDDPYVRQAISSQSHEAHHDLLKILGESKSLPVLQKLAGYIGVKNPPIQLSRLWAQHKDREFAKSLLQTIAESPIEIATANIKRIQQPVWLHEAIHTVSDLNESQQSALLLVIGQCLNEPEVILEALVRLLPQLEISVRRKAIFAICQVEGIKANQVVSYLIDQEADGTSLAMLLPQMRRRNIQGAMKRLLVFLDHGNEQVRLAAAGAFQECSVQRYLAAFDQLDEMVRKSTGQLVFKVDPNTQRVLQNELLSGVRARQLRALIAIRSIGSKVDLQASIASLLGNADPKIREAAAGTLGFYENSEAKSILRRTLMDENPVVRKAAERSLQKLMNIG